MERDVPAALYRRHRFPAEVIAHCVWRYHRFAVSLGDVEELRAARGVAVTYETIGQWCRKFGPALAAALRRGGAAALRPGAGDKWHVDEVQLKRKGRRYWLWRAVDQHGVVLDILVQARRSRAAAETFFRRVVNAVGSHPRVVVTDTLARSPRALREVLPRAEHRRHQGLNNRAEHSHQPTRRRERVMQRFKSPEHAQAQAPRSPRLPRTLPAPLSSVHEFCAHLCG